MVGMDGFKDLPGQDDSKKRLIEPQQLRIWVTVISYGILAVRQE